MCSFSVLMLIQSGVVIKSFKLSAVLKVEHGDSSLRFFVAGISST